ncbi:ATP-binding protein [Mucilaginibacter sp. L196]|uniref:sensor histidine kinase n=1 Tax=Mucilaginibacter sp. L196 TaxID=1641870 RepID=UPI00131BF8EA|nr:ATP-binding protein [Mucilaginibacter sp. L196]
MKIKNRLSLYFSAISTIVLLIVEIVICLIFNSLIKTDFYSHLMDRATVAAQVYLEADEISADSLIHVRERYVKRLPNEVVRFYDDKNTASFIKDKDQYWTDAVINQVRKSKEVEFAEGNRQTVGIYYNDNQGNFVILVSAVDEQGTKRTKDLIKGMAVLLICSMAILFLISRWFAKKSLEPIAKLIKQMHKVSAGNLSLRVDEGDGRDEISELAANFNNLLRNLENAFELQQSFVVNASHELRTPITTIIGEIEISLNKLRTPEEYQQVLRSILTDAERLNTTTTSLLELAQVDMNFTQLSVSPVAIDELIWEINDYWASKAGKGMLAVNILHLPDDAENLQVTANKSLLTVAFNNIIANAFKFSANKRVNCDLYADDKIIKITVADSGVGIPPQELAKIFESFYRGTNGKYFQGTGVGLYVTNKIISLFNGKIDVDSTVGVGTSIAISFIR